MSEENAPVLIMHHVEGYWDAGMHNAGTSVQQLVDAIHDHIVAFPYERVILTQYASSIINEEHAPLDAFITEVHQYGFCDNYDGFEAQIPEDALPEFAQGSNGCVWIAPWMHTLPKTGVYICGAFDGQCIRDLEDALKDLGIDYTRLEHLIVP